MLNIITYNNFSYFLEKMKEGAKNAISVTKNANRIKIVFVKAQIVMYNASFAAKCSPSKKV